MTENQKDILKLRQAGWTNKQIATKLGTVEETVEKEWQSMVGSFMNGVSNGHVDLLKAFTTLAQQYQLLGESLKIMALALNGTATEDQLIPLIVEGDPLETIRAVAKNFIILNHFTMPGADKLLEGLASPKPFQQN